MFDVPGQPWPPPTLQSWLEVVQKEDPPRWFIPGIVPADSVGIISGPPKSKKTILAMILARCLATGTSLLPSIILSNPDPLKIWFLEFEGSRGSTADNWIWLDNAAPFRANHNNILFMHRYFHFSLSDPGWVDRATQFVHDEGISVVFVDTFTEARGDIRSESDTESLRPALRALHSIRSATRVGDKQGVGTVLYVHHLKKPSGDDDDEDIDLELRGSSSLAAGYYIHLAVRRTSDGRGLYLISRAKNDQERYYNLAWDFNVKEKKIALDMKEWQIGSGQHFDLADLERCKNLMRNGKVYSGKELRNLWRAPRQVVEEIVYQLNEMGVIEATAKGWSKSQ